MSNYYPSQDRKKYDRLSLFAYYFSTEVPIFNIYYPTNPKVTEIKVERIMGQQNRLHSGQSITITLPKNDNDMPRFNVLYKDIEKLIMVTVSENNYK